MTTTIRTVRIVALHAYQDRQARKAELLELSAVPVDGGPRALGNVFGSTTDPFIKDELQRALECGTGLVTIEIEDGYLGDRIVSVQEMENVA